MCARHRRGGGSYREAEFKNKTTPVHARLNLSMCLQGTNTPPPHLDSPRAAHRCVGIHVAKKNSGFVSEALCVSIQPTYPPKAALYLPEEGR